jgi:hypothetical protein
MKNDMKNKTEEVNLVFDQLKQTHLFFADTRKPAQKKKTLFPNME